MESAYLTQEPWKLPLPRTSISKPTWRRGQDGDTAIKVVMPHEPPVHKVELATDPVKSRKEPFFLAFDAIEAQDAAMAGRTAGYDHDLPQQPLVETKKRRDSIQDDHSTSASSMTEAHSLASNSPLPTQPTLQAPVIVLTTEATTPSQERAVQVPKELEIDGNAGFDPHRADDGSTPPKRTYLYKGKRYEVQGNEPGEWLKDVREAAPAARNRASMSSPQAGLHSRSSCTPNSILSGTMTRTRPSRRGSSDRLGDAERRRSGRRR